MENNRQKYLRENYVSRINNVIDYIEANISKELTLEELSDVAHFSPFHFHRIFKAMVGETLNSFIQRLRIERAAAMLTQNPGKSITEIAFESGFSGSPTFARAFREAFNMSASEWRAGGYLSYSKNGKLESKESKTVSNNQQDFDVSAEYSVDMKKLLWRVEMKTNKGLISSIEVKDVPEMHVAYIRHIGPYAKDLQLFQKLFNKLCAWAGPRGLLRFPETKFITIYHDNPDITDEAKLRTDVCITVPVDTKVSGEVGKATLPAGKCAVAHFEIMPDQYGDAWNAVYGGWLPESGYQPDDRPCFELYLNEPKQHPQGKHIVDIYAPVKPL
jgi:AraC family transcriptional regulator